MLAFKYRFHGHGSLRFVYKNGRAIRTHLVTLKYTKNPRRNLPRFSVVVSKKVLKSAVGRNRIRRRLYETIRHNINDTIVPCDVVLIVSSSEIISLPTDELSALINDLFNQTELYKNN